MGRRKPRKAQVVNGARVALVAAISEIMIGGDPTPFAYEASARHGIRAGLLLSATGWTWKGADTAAASIVDEALHKAGAKRPTWAQGQPEYTDRLYDTCRRCGKPMDYVGRARFFCGPLCKRAATEATYRRNHGDELNARRRAYEAAQTAAVRPVPCGVCGTLTQQPPRSAARGCVPACSPKCRGMLAAAATRRSLATRRALGMSYV